MTEATWAKVAKISSKDRQWQADIGYYAAETQDGQRTQFTCHDILYAESKDGAIKAARSNYPGIEIETMFDHLTKPRGPAFGHG